MKTIAVTGANGFVGGHLVRALASRGDRVIAFGRRPTSTLSDLSGVAYVPWDITEPAAATYEVDALVHCAGTITDWASELHFRRVNVQGTERVLAAFGRAHRVVHMSTASVYDGRVPKHRVREDAPYPHAYLNGYARSKMLAEQVVRSMRPDAVILRPHAIYGRGETKLLGRLLAARYFGRQLAIGDGRNHISVTHVSNLIQAVERATDHAVSGTFNVADDEAPTVDQLLRHILYTAGLPPEVWYVPTWIAWPLGAVLEKAYAVLGRPEPPRITRYVVSQLAREFTLDTGRAKAELGYRPSLGYREGIRDALSVRLQCPPAPEPLMARRS